jgi:hypothetical protein
MLNHMIDTPNIRRAAIALVAALALGGLLSPGGSALAAGGEGAGNTIRANSATSQWSLPAKPTVVAQSDTIQSDATGSTALLAAGQQDRITATGGQFTSRDRGHR